MADDKQDPGGLTKWGIASRYHPEALDPEFSLDDAKRIYYTQYYLKPRLWVLPEFLQPLMFDMCVNPGHPAAVRMLQQTAKVEGDGVLGSQTANAVGKQDPQQIISRLVETRILYYLARILETPAKQKYAKGWIRRALSYL